jgi:predicted RNA binding protein YcfA (HicA-like mRNA interferase family)
MSKIEKLLEKMRRNPCEWRIEDLEALALRFGLEVRQPSGSHAVFFHKKSGRQLSVPAKRPIKPIYITAFLALLDEIDDEDDEQDEI